jgi:hypothetical protein
MENNSGHDGAAVAKLPAAVEIASSLTLFQIEESLTLLAEAAQEEGLTPEIEEAFRRYLEGAAEKRDRVAEFIHHCDGMAELAKVQVKRLQARQKRFEATAERVESMVLRVLDAFGVTRLEGQIHTLKKRKCPASVDVTDEGEIPSEFKRVTVTLPLDQWNDLLAGTSVEFRKEIGVNKPDISVDLTAVKQALNLERAVPGADLRVNRFSLQLS